MGVFVGILVFFYLPLFSTGLGGDLHNLGADDVPGTCFVHSNNKCTLHGSDYTQRTGKYRRRGQYFIVLIFFNLFFVHFQVVDSPEILSVINETEGLSDLLNSLYNCQYKEFFTAMGKLKYNSKSIVI